MEKFQSVSVKVSGKHCEIHITLYIWFLSTLMLNWMLSSKMWAATNCLNLNLSKTKEIVFYRPRVQYFHMPPPLVDIEQLLSVDHSRGTVYLWHCVQVTSRRRLSEDILRHFCLTVLTISYVRDSYRDIDLSLIHI